MAKQIGILTLYYHNRNYGGLLQAYALQRFLTEQGMESEQICLDFLLNAKKSYLRGFRQNSPQKKVKQVYHYLRHEGVQIAKEICSMPYRKELRKRIEAFDRFQDLIPHSKCVYRVENIAESTEQYQTFICGSDVIWNAGIPPEVSCLGFAKEQKKIAYAPSIGCADPPGWWLDAYGPYLEQLDAVSVREDSVKKGIEEVFPNLQVQTVLDPVFLLSDELWEEFVESVDEMAGNKTEEGYLLCYLLGSSREQRRKITELARKWDKKIVTFPFAADHMFRRCDQDFGTKKQYAAGPEEFLSLVKHADAVITDSFHAAAFSMIFHRPFWAVERKSQENATNLNGRMQNLLRMTKLEERFCKEESLENLLLEKQPDFQTFDTAFGAKREASRQYLVENLRERKEQKK